MPTRQLSCEWQGEAGIDEEDWQPHLLAFNCDEKLHECSQIHFGLHGRQIWGTGIHGMRASRESRVLHHLAAYLAKKRQGEATCLQT